MVAEDRGVVAEDCAHAKLIDARKNSHSCLDDHASLISEAPAHLSIRTAHFLLPAAAFAIANQVGKHAGSNVPMNVLAVVLIAAGIGYIYIIVRQ